MISPTVLPPLPDASSLGSEAEAFRAIVATKLSTYPRVSMGKSRYAKLRGGGFSSTSALVEEMKRLAPHYDLWLLGPRNKSMIKVIKQVNRTAKVYLYFASSLTLTATEMDAGSVDSQTTRWILENRPDYLLKGANGKPIEGFSWDRKFWPDPGLADWATFFVQKLNKLLATASWDGVILDEFLSTPVSHGHEWVGRATKQVKYTSDATWQAAQLKFLRNVVPKLTKPLVPNVEPIVLLKWGHHFNPKFVLDVQKIAAGVELEAFALDAPNQHGFSDKDSVAGYLDTIEKMSAGKVLSVGTNPANLAGDVRRTLYTYCTYLLIAGAQTFWSFKEGTSSVPHFWFKEFDLDIGKPLGSRRNVGELWVREFSKARILVNPTRQTAYCDVEVGFWDTLGNPVKNRRQRLDPHTGMILLKK